MAKATWRIVALSALLGAVAPLTVISAASAQVVVGGSGQPDVIVNWSVLDSLGRQPSLADMIKSELPGHQGAIAPALSSPNRPLGTATAPQGVVYKPFKPAASKTAAKPVVKPTKVATAPKPVPVVPAAEPEKAPAAKVVAEAKPVAKVETKPVSAAKPSVPAKPQIAEVAPVPPSVPAVAAPVVAAAPTVTTPVVPEVKVPQVALPEVKAEAPKPQETAKPLDIAKPVEMPKPVAVAPPAQLADSAPRPLLAPVPPPIPVMPQQVASLPSAEVSAPSAGSDTISLAFDAGEAKLSDRARSDLAALVKRLQKDEDLSLQLLAYASGDEASASKARRLSLSRALEVRKVLMDKGVRSTRIEVRALGNKQDGRGPADRVDAVLVGR